LARPRREDDQFGRCALQVELSAGPSGRLQRPWCDTGAGAGRHRYDLEKLEILPSEVAEDLPGGEWRRIQKSKGYDWILVNGEITFENGEPTGALPGKFLRNGRG